MVWSSNWDSSWGDGDGWKGGGGGGWKPGEGSGGGGWKAAGSSWAAQPQPRQRLGIRAAGILVDWQDKGPKSFGWIAPVFGIPMHLPEAQSHGGDVYVSCQDIVNPRVGSVLSFALYIDGQGLGAEEIVCRSVLRFVVPYDQHMALELPLVEVNLCASYLKSSIFYPEWEERGVTLRKYLWDQPLVVFELWGMPEDIANAAEALGVLSHPGVEVLTSRKMAKAIDPSLLRDISEEELPAVPPRFRTAFPLLAGDGGSDGTATSAEARRRLLSVLGQ